MEEKVIIYSDGNGFLCMREDKLSEGGWVIREMEGYFFIYEVPEFGGKEYFYRKEQHLKNAITIAVNLT